MSVKRYWSYAGGDSSMQETETGNYVKHEDYVALEQKLTDMAVQLANAESKCRELAAELSAVDKIHDEAVFITDDHYEQCPPEVQKIIRSLAVLQIPSCDAFLAEVRAQGVEMAACALDGVNQFNYANMLDEMAQKIRKGAAL
ncbi:hypothetical protein [Citrobacter braakii]|uniref:hypothetical protein n=1 Tax=Citrobacter braakii TaxID=57706 RepID=UPI00397D95ED